MTNLDGTVDVSDDWLFNWDGVWGDDIANNFLDVWSWLSNSLDYWNWVWSWNGNIVNGLRVGVADGWGVAMTEGWLSVSGGGCKGNESLEKSQNSKN